MEIDYLAMTNYFLSFSQANMNFFSLEQKFLSDKEYSVRADGPGISSLN